MNYKDMVEEAACENGEYDPNEVREIYILRMINEGFAIKYPKANELLIDIDNEEQLNIFWEQWAMFVRDNKTAVISYKEESRGGAPGYHLIVTLPFEVSPAERIAWQAALGSDPKRELLSMMRLQVGDKHPTLFVEKGVVCEA